MAGVRLDENFEYASTTREIDYGKFLGHAGLQLEPAVERPEPFAGAIVEDRDGQRVVAAVEPHSPAATAPVAGDVVLTVDGARADAERFDAIVAAGHPGDRLGLAVSRKGQPVDLSLVLAHRLERSFRITPVATPSALQAEILASWTAPARH